jgi:thioredoxin 1
MGLSPFQADKGMLALLSEGNSMSQAPEPSREQLDALNAPAVIEFGAGWCGHCQAAQPLIAEALAAFTMITHHKIEDGPGRRLGRSYKVKLWPTLIFLDQGKEVGRLVRPANAQEISQELQRLLTA